VFKKLTLNNIAYCIIGFVAIYVVYLCITYIYDKLFSTKFVMSCTGKEHKHDRYIGFYEDYYEVRDKIIPEDSYEVKDKTIPVEIIIRHHPFQDQKIITIRVDNNYLFIDKDKSYTHADDHTIFGSGHGETKDGYEVVTKHEESFEFDRITKVMNYSSYNSYPDVTYLSGFEGHCVPAKRD